MILLINKTTKNLKKKEIIEICKLKNLEWKYGLNSQKLWFLKYIKSYDFHNMLIINKKISAYTCLRKRTCEYDKKNIKYLLFDTLIVRNSARKKGIGKLMMDFNSLIIHKKNLPSFLICQKKTINFYKKNNWTVIKKKKFKIMDNNYPNQYEMIFNYKNFKKIKELYLWTNK